MNPHTGNPGPPRGPTPEELEALLAAIPDPPVPRHLAQTLVNGLPVGAGVAAGTGLTIAAWCVIGGLGLAGALALVVMFGPRTTPRPRPADVARPEPPQYVPMVIETGSTNTQQIILKDTNPCRTLPDFCN